MHHQAGNHVPREALSPGFHGGDICKPEIDVDAIE
jgi:hypothetical protein